MASRPRLQKVLALRAKDLPQCGQNCVVGVGAVDAAFFGMLLAPRLCQEHGTRRFEWGGGRWKLVGGVAGDDQSARANVVGGLWGEVGYHGEW